MTGLASPNSRLMQQGVVAKNPPDIVIVNKAPSTVDFDFNIGTIWIHLGNAAYMLLGRPSNVANWQVLTTVTGSVLSLSGDTGSATPNASGIIEVVGGTGVVTSATSNVLTISLEGGGEAIDSF